MNTKPIYNAALAAGYIALIVLCLNWIPYLSRGPEDSFFMPIALLSVLVLSVAVMAYLFFYGPLSLLIGGKPLEAGKLFLGTLGFFGGFTVLSFVLAFCVVL